MTIKKIDLLKPRKRVMPIVVGTSLLVGAAILPEGVREVGEFAIPAGEGQFKLTLDSTQHLNPGVSVDLQMWDSMDGGATWNFRAGGVRSGGSHTGEGGAPITNFELEAVTPQPENPNRRVRIVLDIRGGSLVTAGGRLEFTRDG